MSDSSPRIANSVLDALGIARSSAPPLSRVAHTVDSSDLYSLTPPDARPDVIVTDVVTTLESLASSMAHRVGAVAPAIGSGLLTERERLSSDDHFPASGRTLRGTASLERSADGWIALNLAREDDRECLPALTLGAVDASGTEWPVWLAQTPSSEVLARARLLGLAVGVLPTAQGTMPTVPATVSASKRLRERAWHDRVVVDLSRLWAGPLAAALLAESGAQVLRLVDESARPPVEPADVTFDSRLNGRKENVVLDFADLDRLAHIVGDADVVVTSMRNAALERFVPIPPEAVHLAITAHGTGRGADRIGFGDDCAVEAGLVAWSEQAGRRRPEFLGDAIADPLTGIVAAVAALSMVGAGRSGRVDLALSQVAGWARGVSAPTRAATRERG
ncbi:MAG: CoA transferase [Rhodoglobus sp.]